MPDKIVTCPKLNPKQEEFCLSDVRYTAYGGARSGGKSFVARWKAIMLCFLYAGITCMIMRRSYPELEANHIRQLKEILNGVAFYNKTEKVFRFPNGSMILLRYAASEDDLLNYQGTEVDALFIDEATQITWEMFVKCKAFVRGANDFPKRVYLTCNPGGKGHAWVKRLFIDRKFLPDETPDEYVFIQAKATDNTALMAYDPGYIKQLESLPPKLRKAWLEGSWDIYEGQFFEEFTDNPEGYDTHRYTHVINPFDIPKSWTIYRSFDWGYSKPFSCGYWTIDYDGVLYRVSEVYGCTKTPNEGVKKPPAIVFKEIAEYERERFRGYDILGVADPACWNASTGPSVAETAGECGLYFAKGDNARIPGWMQIHNRLKFDSEGRAKMYVFKNCKHFIRTIPLLIYDEHKPEDLDTEGEDHIADDTRYMCMMRPIEPVIEKEPRVKTTDPLNLEGGAI